jgi:RNA polymerase sigma-70 factor (ECF subfamily)
MDVIALAPPRLPFRPGAMLWCAAPAPARQRETAMTPNQDSEHDHRLMTAVAGGDEAALRQLMERHLGRVLALAQRILGDADEADDVGQEVFTRVWNKAHSFDARRARFGTWLYRITFNLCLDRRRGRRGQWQALDESLADPGPDPGEAEERRQNRQMLAAALSRLPLRQRAALVLHYLQELSARESAGVMGLNEKAFESLVLRARRALREQLEQTNLGGKP